MSWPNRVLLALVIAAAIALLPNQESVEPQDLSRVLNERDALQERVEDLRAEISILEAEVGALHPDPRDPRSAQRVERELARIDREDLNLVQPGEVVFEVVSEERR